MSKKVSPEEINKQRVKDSVRAYLEGEDNCSLNWIKGIIKQSELSAALLLEIFADSRNIGEREKYKILFDICVDAKFNSKNIG